MRLLALLLLALLSACGGGGSLSGEPDLNNADFEYREEFSRAYDAIGNGDALTLKARFIWDGPRGETITSPQHVVLAFTQVAASETPKNHEGEHLWTHGAGAFLGERGLSMELWFRDDTAGNGFDDDPANALVWGQDYGRCARDVRATLPSEMYCLAGDESPTGYITSAPDFRLQKGIAYVLHIRITPGPNGWLGLYAELYQESGDTFVLVQRGFVGFPPAKFFPVPRQPLQASVARTPGSEGEPTIQYMIF